MASAKPTDEMRTFALIFLLNVLIFSTMANIFICSVIARNKMLFNKVVYLFVASLSLNEIFDNTIIGIMLFLETAAPKFYRSNQIYCEIEMMNIVFFTGSTFWHMALISLHRCIVVCYNRCYRAIPTNSYIALMLTLARVMPCALFLLRINGPIGTTSGNAVFYCTYKEGITSIILMVGQFVLPSLIIAASYMAIVIYVYRSTATLSIQKSVWINEHKGLFRIFSSVYILVFLGYSPWFFLILIDNFRSVHGNIYILFFILFLTSKNCNPIIYGVLDYELRKRLLLDCGFGDDSSLVTDSFRSSNRTYSIVKYKSSRIVFDSDNLETFQGLGSTSTGSSVSKRPRLSYWVDDNFLRHQELQAELGNTAAEASMSSRLPSKFKWNQSGVSVGETSSPLRATIKFKVHEDESIHERLK